jgi:acetyl-CoA carboxylase carboxyl transferase subunit beta
MPTEERIRLLLDEDTAIEQDTGLSATDPLGFRDTKSYADRLKALKKATGQQDAFRSFLGNVHGLPVALGVFQFECMGGSMGSVVGEKITRLFERAAREKVPAVILSASGGARMQEGILSLMQMAKTCAALGRLRERGLPYISVLLHPTTGGVAASFALLGDIILAEPGAMIGFAGPRVIEQTIRQKLPEGFQRAEFLLKHGIIDAIVPRPELKGRLAMLLRMLLAQPAVAIAPLGASLSASSSGEITALSPALLADLAAQSPGPVTDQKKTPAADPEDAAATSPAEAPPIVTGALADDPSSDGATSLS